jgi:hypothetical protein
VRSLTVSLGSILTTFSSAGGAWVSLYDLSAIGRSILQSSLMPEHVSREWLKPVSLSNDAFSAVGKPFEIFGMNLPVDAGSQSTRVVYLYTKNGGLGGYNAELILDLDHSIGIAVLVADTDPANEGGSTIWALSEMATRTWVPAAEQAARGAAQSNLAGMYASQDGLNSSISLAIVPDYQGLRITRLVYNGTDFLQVMATQFGSLGGSLQYMNVQEEGRLAFRATWQSQRTSRNNIFLRDCNAQWSVVDTSKYGGFGLDEFVIDVDRNGRATGVEMPALKTRFSRRVA